MINGAVVLPQRRARSAPHTKAHHCVEPALGLLVPSQPLALARSPPFPIRLVIKGRQLRRCFCLPLVQLAPPKSHSLKSTSFNKLSTTSYV